MKKITVSIALALIVLVSPFTVSAAELLVPGGQVIGLELKNDRVTVAAFDESSESPAKNAGLKPGDRITQVDGQTIRCAQDVRQALAQSDGQVALSVQRNGKTIQIQLRPNITSDGPRLGVYLKEGVTGVGTVTWCDPENGTFGALGHGVNDSAGNLLTMDAGRIYGASVVSVKKGQVGKPGQLLGALAENTPIGVLEKNTAQGLFGKAEAPFPGEPLPVAETDEIRIGPATIRSTIQNQTIQQYSVEIVKIYPGDRSEGRNMLLKVTDPALLETTGGIVQGMSGSPIIQDGKLVGAVTHVLVNDPTTGYGIFIENMLDAAA